MLVTAYDGTAYNGWQIQPSGITIEEILNRELSRLLNEEIHVIGASRTDSGVHAEGAVCVFDTGSRIPADKFCFAINQSLPADIKVISSIETVPDFHPRKCPCLKTYRYSIWNDTFELPTKRLYTHWIHGSFDIGAVKRAAAYLVGEHDFKSFCSAGSQALTTVRKITDIRVEGPIEVGDRRERSQGDLFMQNLQADSARLIKDGNRWEGYQTDIWVTGNGFLYNMVRIIAGTLIDVGQGRLKPEDMKKILEARDRSAAGQTAPAKGLTLVGYQWPENIFIRDESGRCRQELS